MTSVAMTGDGVVFQSSVPGSPITTSGTLAPALIPQSAGMAFMGPVSGPSAIPGWRKIQASDLPGGVGTVSSVGLQFENVLYSTAVTNSPITSSGTLLPSLLTQTANFVFAGPSSGPAATPTFRSLAAADLPTSGTWAFAGTISGNLIFSGNPTFTGELLDGGGHPGIANQVLASTGTGVQWVNAGGGGSTDAIEVNGVQVATASITALVNGIGAVGEVLVNSYPSATKTPPMFEAPGNLSSSARVAGTVYQNNTGFPILVEAVYVTNSATVFTFTGISDSSANPSTTVFKVVSPNLNSFVPITFFVLPGQFYKITLSGAGPTLVGWREFQLTRGSFSASTVTGSRSLTTVFHNNSLNTLFVSAQVTGVTSASLCQGFSSIQSPPPELIDDATQTSGSSNPCNIFMIVPPGHYYQVTAASGSLSTWIEYTWSVPSTKTYNLAATTGQGQIRSPLAYSVFVNTGPSTDVQYIAPRTYLTTEGPRVRWIHALCRASTASSFFFLAGEGTPPFLTLCQMSQNSTTLNNRVYGPVMAGKNYCIFLGPGSSNTVTPVSWFEYDIG